MIYANRGGGSYLETFAKLTELPSYFLQRYEAWMLPSSESTYGASVPRM